MGLLVHRLKATDCNASACAKKLGWKDFPKNVPRLSQQYSWPLVSIKVANGSIVQHMATKGDQLQCLRSCQKIRLEGLSQKYPITVPTIFKTSRAYKSCK